MGLLSGLAGLFYLFLKTRGGGVLIMPLIQVVVVLVVVGFVLWLINRFIPMARSIKTILNAVVVIAVILWLLSVFGVLGSLSSIRLGK
jgi:LytS/YehU family sensor histidine kinase